MNFSRPLLCNRTLESVFPRERLLVVFMNERSVFALHTETVVHAAPGVPSRRAAHTSCALLRTHSSVCCVFPSSSCIGAEFCIKQLFVPVKQQFNKQEL